MAVELEYRMRVGGGVSTSVTDRRTAIERWQAEKAWRADPSCIKVEYRPAGSEEEWVVLDV